MACASSRLPRRRCGGSTDEQPRRRWRPGICTGVPTPAGAAGEPTDSAASWLKTRCVRARSQHDHRSCAIDLAASPGGTAGTATLSASGAGLGAIALDLPPDDPPGVPQPTDLALGTDDVLYVARNDAVVLLDRRDRWPAARVAAPGFAAHRLAPAPDGGVWALDRVAGRIARLTGLPLRAGPFAPKNPDVFLPVRAESVAAAAAHRCGARAYRRDTRRWRSPARRPASSPCWRGARVPMPRCSAATATCWCAASRSKDCASR